MDLNVRPAAERDADAVARIYVESWNTGLADLIGMRIVDGELVARGARELSAGRQHWWVAEREDEIVGFVGIGPSRDPIQSDLGELDTIAVAPSQWRTGVGRTLMTTALDALAEDFPTPSCGRSPTMSTVTGSTGPWGGAPTAGREPKDMKSPSGIPLQA